MRWPDVGLFGRVVQLEMSLEPPPHDGDSLLRRLHALGLNGISRCVLTSNRAVMVSYRDDVLRVHESYLAAPPLVLRAIVTFVQGRSRRARRAAVEVILQHAPRVSDTARPKPHPRGPRVRPEDAGVVAELSRHHASYNQRYFGGALRRITIHVSGRMRSRLGQYTAAGDGAAAEITISRSHIRRHGWDEALHTLLHEMVHQWQAEHGLTLDHGSVFREKAREIGIEPRARRAVARPILNRCDTVGMAVVSIPKCTGTE